MHASPDQQIVTSILAKRFKEAISIRKVERVGGGSISNTYNILTSRGNFFLKINNQPDAIRMFEMETHGLELLREKSHFTIPEIISTHLVGDEAFMILEYIDSSAPTATYWNEMGEKLADLHRCTREEFGSDEQNFIGSLPQLNNKEDDWGTFFIGQRIVPMLDIAVSRNLVGKQFVLRMRLILKEITNQMPIEPPALLHGDLWSGNVLTDKRGKPCLIDPAVYYGHREMELAFTSLFGGFTREFYNSYNDVFPLQPGFEERIDLYNLYPLLVHLNIFGTSYLPQIETIIKKFT